MTAGEDAAFGGRRKSVQFASGEISYLEWGAGQGLPPLHFAHANGFNGLTYRALLAPLAERFHIRAWDARGHGQSSVAANPARHRNWYVYRDDLIRFLDVFAEEVGQPVLLAGHSMGGTTSLLATAKRPELVRGIVFADPVMPPPQFRWVMPIMHRLGVKTGPMALAAAAERRRQVFPDKASIVEAYRGRGAFRTWPDEVLEDYVEGGTRPTEDGEWALACSPFWEAANFRAQGHNVWRALQRLRRPFSLLYAEHGSTCREIGATAFRRHDPAAAIRQVEGTTHFLPMEKPQTVRDELVALLEKTAEARKTAG